MAIDKKSSHVGNHGGAYIDNDGMSRQFTYVDHDRHTTRTKLGRETKESKKDKAARLAQLYKEIADYAEELTLSILALPAVNVLRNPFGLYEEFIIRSETEGIIWNEEVVRNAVKINPELGRVIYQQVWKRTVKEQHWCDSMSLEDLQQEKWRELM